MVGCPARAQTKPKNLVLGAPLTTPNASGPRPQERWYVSPPTISYLTTGHSSLDSRLCVDSSSLSTLDWAAIVNTQKVITTAVANLSPLGRSATTLSCLLE